jgi:hypothetical protein
MLTAEKINEKTDHDAFLRRFIRQQRTLNEICLYQERKGSQIQIAIFEQERTSLIENIRRILLIST